jgi:hypothetical protein
MSKPRRTFLALGLAAMIGLMASEARAESLTLSVFAGTDTTNGVPIYTVTGSANSVSANTGILNSDLAGAGFGAYSFSNLGGLSNFPGSTTIGVGTFIQTTGGMSVSAGGSGEGTPITVVLTEAGFSVPTNGPTLTDNGKATLDSLSSGSLAATGIFKDDIGATTITPTGVLPAPGGEVTVSAALAPYVTPFSLESDTTLSGVSDSRDPLVPGAIGFVQATAVSASAVPEPTSIVMLLTSMPRVVLGLVRRRRATG